MMRSATIGVIALLSLVVSANATVYFEDTFESGVGAWTATGSGSPVGTAVHTPITVQLPNQWGNQFSMYDDPGTKHAYAEATATGPTAAGGQLWLSMDWTHVGGYNGAGGTGWKGTSVLFMNDTGDGFALSVNATRADDFVDANIRMINGWSGDFAADDGAGVSGIWDTSGVLGGLDGAVNDQWNMHRIEVCLDWDALTIDSYIDGELRDSQDAVIEFADEYMKEFTKVIVYQKNVSNQWGNEGVLIDNIYAGDAQNDQADPTVVPGDTNRDLKVDLVDLGALATNWGLGGADWSGGDFNCDWTVDLPDLGALATNWGYDGTGVPEPATMALFGLAGVALLRKRS